MNTQITLILSLPTIMNSRRIPPAYWLLLAVIMTNLVTSSATAEDKKRSLVDENVDIAVRLDCDALTESSGLAVSNRAEDHFWSHNDSGDKARLFAFDRDGKNTGDCRLKNAESIDWEDMASFVQDGTSRLIVADCGDNNAKRKSISLYILAEPNPKRSTKIESYHEMIIKYPDGACDCEAIAVDTHREQIVMVAKRVIGGAPVYVAPLPNKLLLRATDTKQKRSVSELTAKRIGSLKISLVSAMDLDAETGDIWVVNYFSAYQYRCTDRNQTLTAQFSGKVQSLPLPNWKQIEAIAVDRDQRVWVTSEGEPAKLGRLNKVAAER